MEKKVTSKKTSNSKKVNTKKKTTTKKVSNTKTTKKVTTKKAPAKIVNKKIVADNVVKKEIIEKKPDKKKIILPLAIGIVTFLILIIGAAYAYFGVETEEYYDTAYIEGTMKQLGTVTLNGNNDGLYLNLTPTDMMQGADDIIYYASSNGKTTTPTSEIMAMADVTPATAANSYHCTYTLSVTHSGTNDLYDKFNHKTNNVYDYTNRSRSQIILTIDGTDYDFYDGWPTNNQVTGEFYANAISSAKITAGLRFINDYTIDQSYLKGSDIGINISLVPGSLSCVPYESAAQKIEKLSETVSSVKKFSGIVTDYCDEEGCNTVNSAQNVYYVTSNDTNNAIFEGFCWRIIRTTETGGVKLFYSGTPTTNGNHQECPSSGRTLALTAAQLGQSSNKITFSQGGAIDHPGYVGYMYNALTGTYYDQLRADNVNKYDSMLKAKTEYWFSHSNIDESKLEDAVYCNDRSLTSGSAVKENQIATATSGNLTFSSLTSLKCTHQTDSFNTTNPLAKTNYKVGFLTYGEKYLISNSPAAGDAAVWLGTPYNFASSTAKVRSTTTGGGVSSINTTNTRAVRPVISVNIGVQITSGEGSMTSPFILN